MHSIYIIYTTVCCCIQVVRQQEPSLIQCVRELCDGNPCEDTDKLLRSLSRPMFVLNMEHINMKHIKRDNGKLIEQIHLTQNVVCNMLIVYALYKRLFMYPFYSMT